MPFPVTTIEEEVPAILEGLPARICDAVKAWSARMPDHPALMEPTGTWTYGQLASAIAEMSEWLVASGIRPGDRVMLLALASGLEIGVVIVTVDELVQSWVS